MRYGMVFNSFGDLFNAMTLPQGGAAVVQDKQPVQAKKYTPEEAQEIMKKYTELLKQQRAAGKWQ